MIYSLRRDIPEMESNLQCALNSLTPWYSANRLSISAKKSAVMLIGKQSQVKNSILAVSINGDPLEQVCSTKYLGVTVDNTLSWDSQCDNLCFKLAGKIAVLRRIRSFVKTETLKLLYEKTIQPVMDYACSVWCHTKKSNINKLQRVQNYAARIITGNFDYTNTQSIDVLRSLRWATVQERCDYFTAVLMFKATCGLTPMYMTDNIVMAAETYDRDARLSNSNDVNIPPHNSDVLKRSFIYNGSAIWNKLPDEIRMATDVSDFKWRSYLKSFVWKRMMSICVQGDWKLCSFYTSFYTEVLKSVFLHGCPLSYLWCYCIMYQIELICVTGQHGRTVVLLNAFTLYKYIWKKKWRHRNGI